MKLNLESKVITGFVASPALLLLVGLVSNRRTPRLTEAAVWARQRCPTSRSVFSQDETSTLQ